LDSSELVVLLPQIALDDLGRSEKSQNRDVASGDPAVVVTPIVIVLAVTVSGEDIGAPHPGAG
jgi:hypothetical protein